MDPHVLVGSQIEDGQRGLEQLARDRFDVTVAFWVKTGDDGLWRFYISSPLVDPEKVGNAFLLVYRSLNRVPGAWESLSSLTLVNDKESVALAAAAARDRHPGKTATRFQGNSLGDLPVSEAYIYSPIDPEKIWLRQLFSVTYFRQDETNMWLAATQPRDLYRGIKAKGPVSYITALDEGEKPGDQKYASVNVLVEIDPKLAEEGILDDPAIRRMMEQQARQSADNWFKSRHPDANVEPVEDDHHSRLAGATESSATSPHHSPVMS